MMEMTPDRWRATNAYAREVFGRQDDHLAGLMPRATAAGIPDIAVSPDVGRLLYLLTRLARAAPGGPLRALEFAREDWEEFDGAPKPLEPRPQGRGLAEGAPGVRAGAWGRNPLTGVRGSNQAYDAAILPIREGIMIARKKTPHDHR